VIINPNNLRRKVVNLLIDCLTPIIGEFELVLDDKLVDKVVPIPR
jgi:hypothetical protein